MKIVTNLIQYGTYIAIVAMLMACSKVEIADRGPAIVCSNASGCSVMDGEGKAIDND